MKWVTYESPGSSRARVGVIVENRVLGGPDGVTLIDLVGRGTEGLEEAAAEIRRDPVEIVELDSVKLLAPVPVPPSIRDFMAFENHAVSSTKAIGLELAPAWYDIPTFYFTNPVAVTDAASDVPVAPGSNAFDYELEVGIVIGEGGENITVEDASRHIAGFMIFCDWSARDLQEHEMRIGLGPAKGKDTATSFGPWMITPDELEDVQLHHGYDLEMSVDVNGQRYSTGNWSTLYWSFEQMIAYASRGTRLVPGDVIGSGTVGTGCILELSRVHGADKYPWLAVGDRVTVAIDRLGSVESTILAPVSPTPLT